MAGWTTEPTLAHNVDALRYYWTNMIQPEPKPAPEPEEERSDDMMKLKHDNGDELWVRPDAILVVEVNDEHLTVKVQDQGVYKITNTKSVARIMSWLEGEEE